MEVSYLQASEIREKLCKILYFCRGANAIVLTQYFNGSLNYTKQQKKQITNQLLRLKEKGIITSKKIEEKDMGSMYYLSTNGLELVHRLLNINPLQSGTMWQQYPLNEICHEELKEYDIDTYKPPIRQFAHHHLVLQSITTLFGNDSDLPSYPFRLTLDAVENYICKNENRMLKPDVEIKVDDEIYTLEIDRATESYSQLVAKFKNYKGYLDYAVKENVKSPITKIIFVYDDKNSNHGVSRRWETIMKAFLEGMNIKDNVRKWPNVELLFVKLSDLPKCVKYILSKKIDNLDYLWNCYYLDKVVEQLNSNEMEAFPFENDSAIVLGDNKSKLIFCCKFQFYTSDFYRQLIKFHQEGKNEFECLDYHSKPEIIPLILGNKKLESWILNFKNTNVDLDLQYKIKYIIKLTKFYQVEGKSIFK